MPKVSGKLVYLSGITRRKNSAQLSTWPMDNVRVKLRSGVKALLIPQLIPVFPQQLSPVNTAPSPLFEHYFYPVSTAPTISPTKEKLKER